MALTQEQQNVKNGFDLVAADVKTINTALATKAGLVGGKLDPTQVPDLALVQYAGTVANQAAMLAATLPGGGALGPGDWVIRSDDAKVYIVTASPSSTAANWQALSYPANPAPDNFSYVNSYNAAKA